MKNKRRNTKKFVELDNFLEYYRIEVIIGFFVSDYRNAENKSRRLTGIK